MLPITQDEIRRWKIEIEQAEKFKNEEFGSNEKGKTRRVGENISYYEQGYSSEFLEEYSKDRYAVTPLNIVHPIVENIIPSLYYKNPHIVAVPKRKQDEDSAPYAAATLNYFYRERDVKFVNQLVVFDAYCFNMGVSKIGYATKFGADIPDRDLEKDRKKGKIQKIKEIILGVKPKEEEKPQNIELNERIIAESPYITWVNPFNFGIDPSASSIYDANYVYERIITTLSKVKSNPNYKNTKDLRGIEIEAGFAKNIPSTQIEYFKPIELYEVHYKTDEGINILVFAADQGEYTALRHEKSIYEMDGFQYEILTLNKHGHKLYSKPEISKIKTLQDRINLTFENILDQIDKFATKLGIDETKITEQGKNALVNGELGAIVYFNTDPSTAYKEISLTQAKSDLMIVIEKMIDMISLETGITKAMLTGLTSAETATEAQIGQAGQNLRLSARADMVRDYTNRQARKFWQVIKQFVDLEEVELITGETAYDDISGTPRFNWLNPIESDMREKLIKGEYDFQIEVGSTEKPDLMILRKQVENLVNILGGKGVLEAFQAQGYKIELAEILKKYLLLFPDVFNNIGRIIKPIQPGMTGLIPQEAPQRGARGVRPQEVQSPPPVPADIISAIGGEKGGQIPFA